MSKRIAVVGPVAPFTGYGELVNALMIGFASLGCEPFIHPTSISERFGSKIPEDVKRRIVDTVLPDSWQLVTHTPETYYVPHKKTIHFTMWESTRLSVQGLQNMLRAIAIITPSQWGSSCFSAQGISEAIFVVPLGVNPQNFNYEPMDMDGPCIFGGGGRISHGGVRKGVNEVIAMFQRAFPTETDVRLRMKVFEDCLPDPVADTRVEIFKDFLSEQELGQWFKGLTAFVSLARAEGWGLMQNQSMATGRPVVACRYAGLAEFMTERNSYCIDYRQREAKEFYKGCGKWAEPNEDSAIDHMRSIYKNRGLAARKGMEAADDVKHLTWENTARKTLDVLKMIGVCE